MHDHPTHTAAAQEWDRVRVAFASSLMVNTPLSSLAQSLEDAEWPIASDVETPAVYIDLDYDDLLREFTARRLPKFAPLLIYILRETLAFDQPFGEMVAQTEAAATRDDPLRRTLAQLGIPADYPLELVNLDASSHELCRLEQVSTLGQLATFAQNLSQTIILGGDLRRLLNALAQSDEDTLASFVPFRTGSTGLHLPEALAQAALGTAPAAQVARTLDWFSVDRDEWREATEADPAFLAHELAVLGDRPLEQQVLRLLAPHFRIAPPGRRSQWWAAFTRWRNA